MSDPKGPYPPDPNVWIPYPLAVLTNGLEYLRAAQHPFLRDLGHDNADPDTLARYGAALMIEMAEFVNELPWKVWSRRSDRSPEEIRAAVLEEWADVLHFIGTFQSLLLHFGITPEDAAVAFRSKNVENTRRRIELLAERAAAQSPKASPYELFDPTRRQFYEYDHGSTKREVDEVGPHAGAVVREEP